jgi:L,D-transpeptidase catalytic domain
MSRFCIAFAVVGLLFLGLARAEAGVVITVNKSTQRLSVVVNGTERHEWPVSTARWGYNTPNGTYQPERLARQWYSRKYDWSPMPYSIFFHGGYAIHGSYEISRLGRPASHGCIRLLPKNAAVLFGIVQANRGDTRIVVTGERRSYQAVARQTHREETSARRHRQRTVERRYRHRAAERRHRERVVERRSRNDADFDEVFAPPSRYRDYTYRTWRDSRDQQSQRELQRWWYGR